MCSRSTLISHVNETLWQVAQPTSLNFIRQLCWRRAVHCSGSGPCHVFLWLWLPVWPVAGSCQRPRGPLAGRILETSGGPCKKPGCLQSSGQKSGVDTKPLLFLIWQSRAGSGWGRDLDTFLGLATDLVFCKWLKKSFHKDWSYVTSTLLVLCLLNGIEFSLFIEHILQTPQCCKF